MAVDPSGVGAVLSSPALFRTNQNRLTSDEWLVSACYLEGVIGLTRHDEISVEFAFCGSKVDVFRRCDRDPQYIPVYAKLTDGAGNVSKTAYLHFELQNCGSNFPIVPGNSQVVVQTAFDIKPNQSDGSILGQVIPNDLILCGNTTVTFLGSEN
jgi:hypothetical protein